jgi:replicative DNA helicase
MEETLDEIEKTSNRPGLISGIPTGFADIDTLTGGLRPSQLTVIGTRGGPGKSTLAQDFLRSAAIRNGLTAALFTLESTRLEVVEHLLAAEARVALHHLRAGTMTDDDWAKLSRRMGEVSAAPQFIQDQDNLTFTQIRDQCRATGPQQRSR